MAKRLRLDQKALASRAELRQDGYACVGEA
jgi:hypothetical protein